MAHSSHTKSSVSIDLFNLPPLPDTRKIVNTWTFDRLTPDGNEGVGVKLDYLECAYGTRYYVINKVNGDINAIHNESLKLMEFKGHFSPFDLDNLEAKVYRLAHGKDEEDVTEQQNTQELHFTDPRTLNMEEYKGMGFDENNCSPIPPVNRASSQNITPRPTSMPKPEDEQILNSSDPTHNRGKVNRINSFNTAQERVANALKNSKGGPFKTSGMKSQTQPSGSNQVESCRPQLNCRACRGCDHIRKDCHEDVFCSNCRMRSHTMEMCRATLGPIPGQDLSATLIELANIQSRSLKMMAASQRSQQEAFQELTRVSKDKSNDSMFTVIKTFDGTNRQIFEDWINEVNQACRASNRGFRTELFKKSAGAVRQVILSCSNFSDDELVAKLRSCFSHAPTMNEAREELCNM